MKEINLWDLYPDVYKKDNLVEDTEEMLEIIMADQRADAAHERRIYRYKAHYSLDYGNGIEKAILQHILTPEKFWRKNSCGRSCMQR